MGVLSGEELRAEESLENLVVDVYWLDLIRLRQFCTAGGLIALFVDGVRAVEQLSREQELLCLEVAGLSHVYRSLRDEPIVLSWAYFFLAVNIRDFKLRACYRFAWVVDCVAYFITNIVHL